MADDHAPDARIEHLETRLAAQEARFAAQIAALRATLAPPRRRVPRRFLPLALVALLVVLTPFATIAAAPFNDLTGGVHDANIGLLYDAGITKGCVPNVSYCPTANVTREEMASFLARTAGLGDNPPVANAKTAQSAMTAQTATTATNAANAANATNAQSAVTAQNATTAQTATNAAQLGGVPAGNYVQAGSRLLPIAFATVSDSGEKLSGTANVTVAKIATGAYYVTISGVTYKYPDYTAVATIVGGVSGQITTGEGTGNKLGINTTNATGTAADRYFNFVVYKP